MGTITDKQINAKPGRSVWLTEDAPRGCGRFMARLLKSGDKLFYFRYTNSHGERFFLPIGNYDQSGKDGLTLREARNKAGEYSRLYQSGIRDIKEHLEAEEAVRKARHEAEVARLDAEKKAVEAEKARQAARKTVREVFEHWASIDIKNRKDGGKEIRRAFEKDVLPAIGNIAVADIRKSHVIEIVDKQLSRGVNRMAKLTFSLMRQMFRFAVDRDFIENDPTASIRKTKIGGKDTERDRVLSGDEIKLLGEQLANSKLLVSSQIAIWIALSTCCRIGELTNAKWGDVDLKDGTWIIPEENSKNGKSLTIFLSQFAIRQFRSLRVLHSDSEWCYPNKTATGPVCSKTITKQVTDRQRSQGSQVLKGRSANPQALSLNGGRWTPHDLRRTGVTIMVRLGVLPEVAERCLNHTEENRMQRIYQRHDYAHEMKVAWQILGSHLEEILS